MSWIAQLYETYENCKDAVGVIQADNKTPLLPIAHSTQNAQVEVVINGEGNFVSAEVVDKDDAVTIIPCTEDSSSRSGKAVFPHPLCDKLQYIAGDYGKYGGEKGDGFYKKYIEQLEDWCNSPYNCREAQAILSYLKKGTLISDLVTYKVLFCGEDGKLPDKWTGSKNEMPKIFSVSTTTQNEAFVRFKVNINGNPVNEVWKNKQVWDSYINYCLSQKTGNDICYVTGKIIPCSDKHPAKIRNTADKAKLISANDASGFTYRGRFSEGTQAVRVGYVPSQEAHNALRWLIDRQGRLHGDQAVVAWGSKNEVVPPVDADSLELFSQHEDDPPPPPKTQQAFALQLNKTISGYGKHLDTKAHILVIAVDAATVGRLSITYYRELNGSDFLKRLERWHDGCSWLHTYKWSENGKDEKGKPVNVKTHFYGAPAPKDIAEAAYGKNCPDKLKKATVERLLPCIIDGARLPYDIVQSVVRQASRCAEMEWYDWEKALSIGCALVRKYRNERFKEDWKMNLEDNLKDERYLHDRSVLFGSLLAVADKVEQLTYRRDENRMTNAMRYMNAFSQRPYKTWQIIIERLTPYFSKLYPGTRTKYQNILSEINSRFIPGDYESSDKLEGKYLLGFYCQRESMRKHSDDDQVIE